MFVSAFGAVLGLKKAEAETNRLFRTAVEPQPKTVSGDFQCNSLKLVSVYFWAKTVSLAPLSLSFGHNYVVNATVGMTYLYVRPPPPET